MAFSARGSGNGNGSVTSALSLPRALSLLVDPRVPLGPDVPGLPGRAYRSLWACVCTPGGGAAEALVPPLCERAGALRSGAAVARCAELVGLVAGTHADGAAAALENAIAAGTKTTRFGALRLLRSAAEKQDSAAWFCVLCRRCVGAMSAAAREDIAADAPRRVAAIACDVLVVFLSRQHADEEEAAAQQALDTVVACERKWLRHSSLFQAALGVFQQRFFGERALAGAARLLLLLPPAPAFAGHRGVVRALECCQALDRQSSVVELALLLARRSAGHGFDDVVLTSSVVPRLARSARLLLVHRDMEVRRLGVLLLSEAVQYEQCELLTSDSSWAGDGDGDDGAAELVVAVALNDHASDELLARAFGVCGGVRPSVLRRVVLLQPPLSVLLFIFRCACEHGNLSPTELARCLAPLGDAALALVCLLSLLQEAPPDTLKGAAVQLADALCSEHKEMLVACADVCAGNGSMLCCSKTTPEVTTALQESTPETTAVQALVDAAREWVPKCSPVVLEQALPEVVAVLLSRPESVHSVQFLRILVSCLRVEAAAALERSAGEAVCVLADRMATQQCLSEQFLDQATPAQVQQLLFERLAPVLLLQVLSPLVSKQPLPATGRAAELLVERLAGVEEFAQVRSVAEQALAGLPPACVVPLLLEALEAHRALADVALEALLRAAHAVFLRCMPLLSEDAGRCDAFARCVVQRAATAASPGVLPPAVKCTTCLVQAQVQHAKQHGKPPHSRVLSDLLLGNASSSTAAPTTRAICAAALHDLVQSMEPAPRRETVTPLLQQIVHGLSRTPPAALQCLPAAATAVRALLCALRQAHGADLYGSARTAQRICGLALGVLSAAEQQQERSACGAALALLARVLAEQPRALLESADQAAASRLCAVVRAAQCVARREPPGSELGRLALAILQSLGPLPLEVRE